MIPRLKAVSKIAQIIDHQKEVIELQLQEFTHQQTLEVERLKLLEKGLRENIDHFEKGFKKRVIFNSEEVAFLFGMASTFFKKMEQKKREIEKIEKELEAIRGLFLEALRKKKAVEIVQDKIKVQNRRAEAVLEQKNLDYLTISGRLRQ
jgi:hypothetical protein